MWSRFCYISLSLYSAAEDYERYMDNVEEVAALYPMIVEWDTYAVQVKQLFF